MKLKVVIFAALAASSLSGCATVVNGTSQKYQIDTNPKGAAVSLTDGESCVSPCKLNLKRRNDQRADIVLQGYKPTYVLIRSKTSSSTSTASFHRYVETSPPIVLTQAARRSSTSARAMRAATPAFGQVENTMRAFTRAPNKGGV